MAMKKNIEIAGFVVLSACVLLFCSTVYASDAAPDIVLGDTVDMIVLTPGHSRSIYFELNNTVSRDPAALHSVLIMTIGTGTLTVGIANHSAISGDTELIYGTTGIIGTTPIADYSYSAAPISKAVPVGNIGVGVLVTGIFFSSGSPDFPITMYMLFSLN